MEVFIVGGVCLAAGIIVGYLIGVPVGRMSAIAEWRDAIAVARRNDARDG